MSTIFLIFLKIGSIRPIQVKINSSSTNLEIGVRGEGVARVTTVFIGRGFELQKNANKGMLSYN